MELVLLRRVQIQSTSKYFCREGANCRCDIEAHVNSPGTVSTGVRKKRNSTPHDPLPSVNDIAKITENELEDNTIFIAQTEINCLDDLSLDGDVPDDVSDT